MPKFQSPKAIVFFEVFEPWHQTIAVVTEDVIGLVWKFNIPFAAFDFSGQLCSV